MVNFHVVKLCRDKGNQGADKLIVQHRRVSNKSNAMHGSDDLRNFERASSDDVDDVANAISITEQQETGRILTPYKGGVVFVEQLPDLQLESRN